MIQHSSSSTKVFFLIYSLAQITLEILVLGYLGHILKKRFKTGVFTLFIGFCFVWFLSRFIDFVTIRLSNISVWKALDAFIFNESMENFIELIQLSGLPLGAFFLLVPLVISIPFVGIIFYKFCEKISKQNFIQFPSKKLLSVLVVLPLFMVVFDITHLSRADYLSFQKVLPWKQAFFSPKNEEILFQGLLKGSQEEEEALIKLDNLKITKEEGLPNIYFFVSESLRDDYITNETAPNLSLMKKESIFFEKSLSNANATHLSWFAIFHSEHPFKWVEKSQKNWKSGSLALQALKKKGYQIRLYSAAQLKYYGMDELIFGAERQLVDFSFLSPHYHPKQPYESDLEVIDQVVTDIQEKHLEKGQLFIIFLDSTHFNYSWPPSFEAPFTPYASDVNLLYALSNIKDLDRLKNRYKNAIYFCDHLFGKVVNTLKKRELYEEAQIVFTGDHGEEFYEHGQLFHATQLSQEQLSAPIIMKLSSKRRKRYKLGSHIQIFPTLIHSLFGSSQFDDLVDGDSVIEKDPSSILSVQNAWSHTPEEFQIQMDQMVLRGRFCENRVEVFNHSSESETPFLKELSYLYETFLQNSRFSKK